MTNSLTSRKINLVFSTCSLFLDLLNWWSIDTISMIGMKESEWIEIFPPTHDILNLEPCVWRPVWDKWRLVVPSCGAPSQNSGYLEWKVNDCQEAICRENWSNTWAIWKNKAHPWPKKKQSKLQSMSSRCNLWSSGTMVQTARPDWANHCVSCQLSISSKCGQK